MHIYIYMCNHENNRPFQYWVVVVFIPPLGTVFSECRVVPICKRRFMIVAPFFEISLCCS